MFNTGSGHVLLAFASEHERAIMIAEHELAPNEVCPDDLDQRLVAIRERGYESSESEQALAVLNLSAPVFGPNRSVVAALSCPYLTWNGPDPTPDVASRPSR